MLTSRILSIALVKKRDSFLAKLQELAKNKPKTHDDDALISTVRRLDSSIAAAKDDLSAAQLRLKGLNDELKHVNDLIKKTKPDVQRVRCGPFSALNSITDL